jgi:hypothetical protein
MVFGSTVLEVIVGMTFVYLLLSLLCAAIGEYIETIVNNRAKLLKRGIELLLNDTGGGGDDLARRLYAHGLIRPLYRSETRLPSYIPSRTFAMALWNMATSDSAGGGVANDLKTIRARVAGLPNVELRTALLTLIDEANGDLARARANVEQWYESAMDRVSGWYKRKSARLMVVLGFVVAAVLNADTINLAAALARDGALRTAVVEAAEQRLDEPEALAASVVDPERAVAAAYDEVKALGLPIGWVQATAMNANDLRRTPVTGEGWLLKLLGILLTGLAISQGAPFWFDLLNKVMVIRSTVKPKEKSTEQPSKDRPAPQTEIETPGESGVNKQ